MVSVSFFLMFLFCFSFSKNEQIKSSNSGTCGEHLTYRIDSNILYIDGTGAMTNFSHMGTTPWYPSAPSITKVNISEGVTTIGNCAFSQFQKLESIVIPESVVYIGEYAFCFCPELLRIDLPPKITSIEPLTFMHCYKLMYLDIPYGVTIIKGWSVHHCHDLAWINIPETVTVIEEHFLHYSNNSLTSVTIPKGVSRITNCSFSECTNLKEIHLLGNITEIDIGGFYGLEDTSHIYYYGTEAPKYVGNPFNSTNHEIYVTPSYPYEYFCGIKVKIFIPPSSSFSQSAKFTKSNVFSNSNSFTTKASKTVSYSPPSNSFSYLHLSPSKIFSSSNTFSLSNTFSQSDYNHFYTPVFPSSVYFTNPEDASKAKSVKNKTFTIIGIVVGAVALVAAAVILIIYSIKRKKIESVSTQDDAIKTDDKESTKCSKDTESTTVPNISTGESRDLLFWL